MPDSTIPWARMMGLAFTRWSLSPEAFWSMTLTEFAAAVDASLGQTACDAPGRDFLEAMLKAHPDTKGSEEHE